MQTAIPSAYLREVLQDLLYPACRYNLQVQISYFGKRDIHACIPVNDSELVYMCPCWM